MAPTICITDAIDDHRVSFSVEDHLFNLKSTHNIGEGVRNLHIGRRPKRLIRLRNFKISSPLMGLVVDECQQSLSFEGDSPGLPCGDTGDTSGSETSTRPGAKRYSEYHLQMIRRREGLLDITVRTIALIRRNQQLQLRLSALQAETRAFVQSVLKNPENQCKSEGYENHNNDDSTALVK